MKKIESMPTDGYRPTDDGRHFYEYLSVINRRKWYILLFFMVVVGIVAIYSFRADPVYRASALLMIDRKPSPMNPMGEGEDRSSHALVPYYNTQINLLSHRSLIESVIEELDLKKFYAGNLEEEQLQEDAPPAQATSAAAVSGKDELKAPDPATARILRLYNGSLVVEPVRDSNLVRISFSGSDPVMITRIVNTHAEQAIESAVAMHREHAENALKWIRAQVEKQKEEVENYQKRIYAFKKANNLVTMGDPRNIHNQELTDLNAALTRAKADSIAKHTAYLQAEKLSGDQLEIFLSPEVLNNSVIAQLRNQLVELKGMQIELGSKFGPKHPRMVELNAGINQTRAELEAEISRLKRAYKTEAEKAVSMENSIEQMLEERKNLALRLGEKSIEYDVLHQQAESSREIYDFLLQQAEEINLFSVMSSSNLRVIDRADVPILPVSPNIKMNIMAAAALSLMLAVGLVLFFDYMDNTLKTPDEVTRYLGIPVLGTVPYYKELKHNGNKYLPNADVKKLEYNEMVDGPLSSISSRLPAELASVSDGTLGRVIAIESVTMGEGKTMTTAKMAASLSEAGLRVLLLDCDFQRSSLNKIFDNADGGGLEDIIERIHGHQVTSGNLKDYSMDDLFFLIGLHKLNGRLIVKNEDQLLHALFQNGNLLHIQNSNNPKANRIGAMLLQANFITKEQLSDAVERHRRTGQPLGYIMVNSGYITMDKLRGPLRLQMEEHLQRLFSWKTGQFSFKPELIRIYENERIFFGDNHSAMIRDLGRMAGSKVIEKEILSNIHSGSKENMYFLPANSNHKRPIGRVNRALLKKILEIVKERFDVVLVDTPPLDARTGIESLLTHVDGVIVVIDAGRLSYRVINSAMNTLPKDKIIGAVLNKVKTKENNYAYYM